MGAYNHGVLINTCNILVAYYGCVGTNYCDPFGFYLVCVCVCVCVCVACLQSEIDTGKN